MAKRGAESPLSSFRGSEELELDTVTNEKLDACERGENYLPIQPMISHKVPVLVRRRDTLVYVLADCTLTEESRDSLYHKLHFNPETSMLTSDEVCYQHLPLKILLIVSGLWNAGGTSAWIYLLWQWVVGIVMLGFLISHFWFWFQDVPGWACSHDAMEHLAESSHMALMAASWWFIRKLFVVRGAILVQILCDRELLSESSLRVSGLWAFSILYILWTGFAFYKISENAGEECPARQHPFCWWVLFSTSFPFVASIMVWALTCLHVADQVDNLTILLSECSGEQIGKTTNKARATRILAKQSVTKPSSRELGRKSQAQASFWLPGIIRGVRDQCFEATNIGAVAYEFNYICDKVKVVADFYNPWLFICNACALMKFVSVLLDPNKTESSNFEAWILLFVLAGRVLVAVLLIDYIATWVSTATYDMQGGLTRWRPLGVEGNDDTCPSHITMICHEHEMLVDRCTHLQLKNFDGFSIGGFPLTSDNFVRMLNILATICFATLGPLSQRLFGVTPGITQ